MQIVLFIILILSCCAQKSYYVKYKEGFVKFDEDECHYIGQGLYHYIREEYNSIKITNREGNMTIIGYKDENCEGTEFVTYIDNLISNETFSYVAHQSFQDYIECDHQDRILRYYYPDKCNENNKKFVVINGTLIQEEYDDEECTVKLK